MSPVPHERTLRCIVLGCTIAGFPMLIATAILSANTGYELAPTWFSILPLYLSFFTSVVAVRSGWEDEDADAKAYGPKKISELAYLIIDTLCSLAFLGVLLAIWIIEPGRLWGHGDYLMLETYGSCCLMVNTALQGFCAVQRWTRVLRSQGLFRARLHECPRCHYRAGEGAEVTGERSACEGYRLLEVDADDDVATLTPEASGEGSVKGELEVCGAV